MNITNTEMYNHLIERGLYPENYNGIMTFDDVVIFPLWNLSGQMVGYQQYRPEASKERKNDPREGRYYISLHGDKNEKPIGVWGLESLSMDPHILIITEGIFDACQFHRFGVPAIALLNSSYKHYRNFLTCLGRKIYKVEDDHGSKLGPYTNIELPEGKTDVGECDEFEVFDMLCKTINLFQLHSIMGYLTTKSEESSPKITKTFVDVVPDRQLDGTYTLSTPECPEKDVNDHAVYELSIIIQKAAAASNIPLNFVFTDHGVESSMFNELGDQDDV